MLLTKKILIYPLIKRMTALSSNTYTEYNFSDVDNYRHYNKWTLVLSNK